MAAGGPARIVRGAAVKHALLLASDLTEPGGGCLVAAWAAEALLREYRVTLATWRAPALASLDSRYGTSLARHPHLTVWEHPAPQRRLLAAQPLRLALLRRMLLERRARRLIDVLDPAVIVSTCNETDLGRPLVQYVHYPWAMFPRPDGNRWFHWGPASRLYRSLLLRLSRFDPARQGDNLTLVNSDWTGALYRHCYGLPSATLHPPVPVEGPMRPWSELDNAFACVARISREKRLVEAIGILSRVRAAGHAVELRIFGWRDDPRYLAELQTAAAAAGDWVRLLLDLPREHLIEQVGGCRYGLHTMIEEHFGIAVAELLRLGCLPFVHASGGPREIVGELPLTFGSDDEAVTLIAACLSDQHGIAGLRQRLAERAARFSVERFAAGLLASCAALEVDKPGSDAGNRLPFSQNMEKVGPRD